MIKGKTAVVTGGSRGIGRSVAVNLASQGANVAIIYFGNDNKASEVKKEVEKHGVKCEIYKCDVSDYTQSENTVKEIIEYFGGIDILVNNAGITKDKLVLQMSEEDFDCVVDTNLKGAFNMIKHCYKNFMKKRYGKIINISSVSGLMGNAGQANYSSAKSGIIGLTKSVAKELAGRNIYCNAVAPGFIVTDMTEKFQSNDEIINAIPLQRMGTPDDVAKLVVFLADEVSDYITGEVIRVDGGMAM